ncbi:UbiA family prenyltransferase [Kitasatospora sp. HPMI-4]|uniref:UbiA family prenyltransferase n=1 Tax=Kitasatospora sp. HPMI-4 TaxID=3448443 RepID=UPI003F1C4DA3
MLIVLSRPAVAVLFALYVALGLAQARHAEDRLLLAECLLPVMAFLLCSVCVNDLSDQAIDQVNLPGDRSRPLVTAAAGSRDLVVTAMVSAAVALASAFVLGPRPGLLMLAALAVSTGYSLRPLRLADRGAVAALALPACYVALPYLLALTAARSAVHPRDLLMLLGLYTGFIGRILLKDFRDVRGDALFGKRTFLVRHGRRATCLFSACCWTVGSCIILIATPRPTPALVCSYLLCLAVALLILRTLAGEVGHRREEALITGAAVIGRGLLILQLAHLAMDQAGWGALAQSTVVGALLALTLGQAVGPGYSHAEVVDDLVEVGGDIERRETGIEVGPPDRRASGGEITKQRVDDRDRRAQGVLVTEDEDVLVGLVGDLAVLVVDADLDVEAVRGGFGDGAVGPAAQDGLGELLRCERPCDAAALVGADEVAGSHRGPLTVVFRA